MAPALPDHPVPPFQPAAAPPGPVEDWIFSGLLDDGRQTYSGTLLTGSGTTEFAFELGAGVTCTGGDTSVAPNMVRLTGVPCSDERTMQASFIARGDAELTVFGQIGPRRFTTSAHRLGLSAPSDHASDDGKRETPPNAAPGIGPDSGPPAAPPAAPAPSRPRDG